jgi:hypothetical protein
MCDNDENKDAVSGQRNGHIRISAYATTAYSNRAHKMKSFSKLEFLGEHFKLQILAKTYIEGTSKVFTIPLLLRQDQ